MQYGSKTKVFHKVADAVREMEGGGYQVTVFLIPGNRQIRGVDEAGEAARAAIGEVSMLTGALSERVHELSRILPLIKAERANDLHFIEDDFRISYYT